MPTKSIEQARNESDALHAQYMSSLAGATYQCDLRLQQIENKRPLEDRRTEMRLPAVRLTSHQERHTDKYNLRDLQITNLLNLYISLYQCRHHCLPSIISLSPSNIQLLELQGFRHSIYRCELGVFLLFCDTQLDNDTIHCS